MVRIGWRRIRLDHAALRRVAANAHRFSMIKGGPHEKEQRSYTAAAVAFVGLHCYGRRSAGVSGEPGAWRDTNDSGFHLRRHEERLRLESGARCRGTEGCQAGRRKAGRTGKRT